MNSLPAYFFSDAHLGANPPGAISSREEILVRFLRSLVGKASHVFLVGDLFEFWYEYRHYIARGHFPLYRVLGDLSDFGAEVHLLMGNHDFALEDFFPRELGVRVHRRFVCENLQGHNVFLMHGDGIPGSDRGYRLARKILDARISRFLFRKIHPDLGMDIARFVGNGSRAAGPFENIIAHHARAFCRYYAAQNVFWGRSRAQPAAPRRIMRKCDGCGGLTAGVGKCYNIR